MPGKLESSIHMATKSCIARCRSSETPLASLAEFADRLQELGWDRESVHEVEKGVLFALMGQEVEQRQLSDSA